MSNIPKKPGTSASNMSNIRTKLGLPASLNAYEKVSFHSPTGHGFTSNSVMTQTRLSSLLQEDTEDNPLSSAPAYENNNFTIVNLFVHSYLIESDEKLYVYTEDEQKANLVRSASNIVYLNVESVDVIVYNEQGFAVEFSKDGVHTFHGISSESFSVPDAYPIQVNKSASFLDRCVDAGFCVRHPPSIDLMHDITEQFINWRSALRPFEKMILIHHAYSLCDALDKAVEALEPDPDSEGFVSAQDVHEGLLLRDRLECLLMFDLSDEEDLIHRIHNIDHRYKVLLRIWVRPEDDVDVNIDERLWMAESGDLNIFWGGSNLT